MPVSGEFPTLEIEVRDSSRLDEAEAFARQTGIPLVSSSRVPVGRHRVVFLDDGIELWDHDCIRRGTRVDFTQIDTRIATGNISKNQPLAKAIGRNAAHILDATAGFGHDAMLLACMGFTITAIERNPLIHLLIQDGVQRASTDSVLGPIINTRFDLKFGDAITHIQDTEHPIDVIYLDPMFESGKSRSALPKKPAQILRDVVGEDADSTDLLMVANASAKRVVVKRTDNDPPLSGVPTHTIKGKIVRYDVYINT